ncbi:MAG TPA: hypothetical protein VJI68_02095 [Candidatus Nanoarchaeia archaeon]|nr:hypothetical protein [Candidatus Nanoarchaeia archaeon]
MSPIENIAKEILVKLSKDKRKYKLTIDVNDVPKENYYCQYAHVDEVDESRKSIFYLYYNTIKKKLHEAGCCIDIPEEDKRVDIIKSIFLNADILRKEAGTPPSISKRTPQGLNIVYSILRGEAKVTLEGGEISKTQEGEISLIEEETSKKKWWQFWKKS